MKCELCGYEPMDCYKISKSGDVLERRFRCMTCGHEEVIFDNLKKQAEAMKDEYTPPAKKK